MYEDSGPATKRHERGDLIDVPVAVECSGGLLRYRPIARSGISNPCRSDPAARC